jgi:hypothetical protein
MDVLISLVERNQRVELARRLELSTAERNRQTGRLPPSLCTGHRNFSPTSRERGLCLRKKAGEPRKDSS